MRKRLPETREGLTKKAIVAKMEYYVTVNFYTGTATPGEVFIKIAKEGSTVSGLIDALAITISIALQYGVEWEVLGDKYLHTIFEPRDDLSSSLVDGIAQTITKAIEERACLLALSKEQHKDKSDDDIDDDDKDVDDD